MRLVWAIARLAVAAAMAAAVIRLLDDAVNAGTFVLWNFFGFFTIQNNIIGVVALLVAVAWGARARPAWVEYLRLCAATYLAIVVTVYWTLLAPVEEGSPWEWTNLVLHGLSGVWLVLDWLVEGPRRSLSLRTAPVVLAYPLVWITVVLIRGATDGWFPYPFLNPSNGYGSIAVVVAIIIGAGLAVGAALMKATRWRLLTTHEQ